MYKKLLAILQFIVYIYILQISTVHAGLKSINYDIKASSDNLEIRMCTVNEVDYKTEIKLPILFGQGNGQESNLIETTVGNVQKTLYPEYDYLILNHNIGDLVCIRYKIYNLYYPQDHLFFITNNALFFIAEYVLASVESDQDVQVAFKFNNWQRPVISNLNFTKLSNGGLSWQGTSEDSIKSFFISGPYSIIKHQNQQPNIILSKSLNKAYINDLVSYLAKMTTACQSFFSTEESHFILPNNSFVLINNGKENLLSNSGTAQRSSSFSYQIIFSNTNNCLNNELKHVLMHEYLHQWMGLKLKPKNLQANDWFFEGAVDYYAAKLNYVFKFYDADNFFAFYNNVLKEYYSFNFDKIEINDLVKQIPIYDLLEYRIGFLLSSIIDNKLSKMNPKYNLDFFIKNIVNEEKNFDLKEFLKKIKSTTNIDFTQLIHETLNPLERALLKHLPNKICIHNNTDCRKLQLVEMLAPDYEFDIFNSLKFSKVKGIKPGSVAYKQGLRNEQDIKSFIKYPKNDQIYLEIVSAANSTKKFSVYPIYKTIKLPQYVND